MRFTPVKYRYFYVLQCLYCTVYQIRIEINGCIQIGIEINGWIRIRIRKKRMRFLSPGKLKDLELQGREKGGEGV